MFKKKAVKAKSGAADTLITQNTKIVGNISFSGVLYVDGHIHGNIEANDTKDALVTVGLNGHIEGDVHSPHVVIFGEVEGDVRATEHIELKDKACVKGDVSYKLIEMAMGAEVNGKLLKLAEEEILAITHHKQEELAIEEKSKSKSDMSNDKNKPKNEKLSKA
jgi:cytoskeletal protein CcmA (bactofilin family)